MNCAVTMERVQRNAAFIRQLKSRNGKKFIKTMNQDQIKMFGDLAANICFGNVKLSRSKLRKLREAKNKIRLLAAKWVPLRAKRRVLQKGGALFSVLLPILASVASAAISAAT